MKQLKNKVAAVTGCASGIGRELAINLAKNGCNIAISDINKKELEETAKLIDKKDIKITTHVLDVSKKDEVYQYADDVVKEHGHVDILINNAGVTVGETLEDISYEDFEWVIAIDFWGVVYGTKAFLPYLKKRPESNIVNISSINGMVPFPNNGPYNAAKHAVKAFNNTLIQELRGTSIKVTSVHPGGIKTNIVRNMRFHKHADPNITQEELTATFEKISMTTSEKAARVIISGMKKNKKRLLVGLDAKLLDLSSRLFPVSFTDLLGILSKVAMK